MERVRLVHFVGIHTPSEDVSVYDMKVENAFQW